MRLHGHFEFLPADQCSNLLADSKRDPSNWIFLGELNNQDKHGRQRRQDGEMKKTITCMIRIEILEDTSDDHKIYTAKLAFSPTTTQCHDTTSFTHQFGEYMTIA